MSIANKDIPSTKVRPRVMRRRCLSSSLTMTNASSRRPQLFDLIKQGIDGVSTSPRA